MADNVNLYSVGRASQSGLNLPGHWQDGHAKLAAELVAAGSVEFSHGSLDLLAEHSSRLPYAMPVYVPLAAHMKPESRIPVVEAIVDAQREPVLHVPVNGFETRAQLTSYINAMPGVQRVLLIGGDNRGSTAAFSQTSELINSGLLVDCGITEIGVAGFPEGHPAVPEEELTRSLMAKIEAASNQGLGCFVITQFTLVPQRITQWCSRLSQLAGDTPVLAGIPGPASHEQLVRFANICGVSTSLSAVSDVGVKLTQVIDHERPGQQLKLLAAYNASHPASNIVGTHVYGFGGFAATVDWIEAQLNPR